ncbi:MAG: FAD/NAD(P)-binding protein [Rhizobacter sp.]|nr:FAD/NAD(P)-binding protein [Ferruginibacter sp.]
MTSKTTGLIGGGPAAIFMYKRLTESHGSGIHIHIFEKNEQLGVGMPYSKYGACGEHITNVSGNEIPFIQAEMHDWIYKAPAELKERFDIDPALFNDYKVVPRLLFGAYLADQFEALQKVAKIKGIKTTVHLNTIVTDVQDGKNKVIILTGDDKQYDFDEVVICTGHSWPKIQEGKVPNWFDSPYPPQKLAKQINYPVAIKGSALTAIDAIRTLARSNGSFNKNEDHTLTYTLHEKSAGFKIAMHSLDGMMPAIRFHLKDTQLSQGEVIGEEEGWMIKKEHAGFIPLDLIYERNFLQPLKQQQPDFYETIKYLKMEEFVAHMMELRERVDGFTLFKAEYKEAEQSIKRKESIAWKEMLATLSYAMNYPAKHLSAEDMLRLKKVLMPLISIIIAFVPQTSCRELLALHDAGILELVAVDRNSKVVAGAEGAVYYFSSEEGHEISRQYKMYVDATGQPQFMYDDFPFKGLKESGSISAAYINFKEASAGKAEKESGNEQVAKDDNGNYYLKVPGIQINDHFQVLDKAGAYNRRIYIMAVPHIGGLNPDYSGLDFCEAASARIIKSMLTEFPEIF